MQIFPAKQFFSLCVLRDNEDGDVDNDDGGDIPYPFSELLKRVLSQCTQKQNLFKISNVIQSID